MNLDAQSLLPLTTYAARTNPVARYLVATLDESLWGDATRVEDRPLLRTALLEEGALGLRRIARLQKLAHDQGARDDEEEPAHPSISGETTMG